MTDNGLPPGFGTNNPDFIREAYVESQKMGEPNDAGGTVVFFKSGVTFLRLLPPHEDAESWFFGYKEHGLHPDGKFRTVTCPATEGEIIDCPICVKGNEFYEAKGEENLKKAKRLYVKSAFLYNAYIYNNPDGKGLKDGIVVVKSGVKVYKQFMEYDNDPAGDWGDISNIQKGIDFRVTRKGSGRLGTEYVVSPVPNRSNIYEKVLAEGLEFGKPRDLSKVYPPLPYEDLVDLLERDDPPSED